MVASKIATMNRNMTRQPAVYGLQAGGSFGYVGMTLVNVKTRLWEHRSRARKGHSAPVYDWMRSVGVSNVEIIELDANPASEASWIAKLIDEGHPIANQKARDGVPGSMSESSKKRIGDKNTGKSTWIKGKTGEAAGWTKNRRIAAAKTMAETMSRRKAQ